MSSLAAWQLMLAADCRILHYSDQYPLRTAVLGQPPEPKPGDDAPDTLHVGVFVAGRLVSIASIYHEPPPGSNDPDAWRLRGMATLPDVQGQGCGRLALERCIEHVRAHCWDMGLVQWARGRDGLLPRPRIQGRRRCA